MGLAGDGFPNSIFEHKLQRFKIFCLFPKHLQYSLTDSLFSSSVVSNSSQTHGLQHSGFPCLSPSPRVCSNSYAFCWWCHPTILSSVVPFSSCPQSFPASRSFPMSWLFISGGQIVGASASVLPVKCWFPICGYSYMYLGVGGFISLQYFLLYLVHHLQWN